MSLLRPRKTAKHAKPSAAAPVLAAGGLVAALAVGDALLLAPAASAHVTSANTSDFDRLAQCESGGRWNINTGNGYYGGIQFSAATWRGIGYGGLPHQASRETQIEAGKKLQSRYGWGQWPACSRKLGLRGGSGAAPAAAAAPAPRANLSRRTAVSSAEAPFAGTVTSSAYRVDVQAWQARMKQRGWKITVDGRFGPQSSSVAQRFAAEKGVPSTPRRLTSAVYGAAWSAPVT